MGMQSKKAWPDYIQAKGVAATTTSINKNTFGIQTEFQLVPGLTYSITARRRQSPFYCNVFGAFSAYPTWNGSQFYTSSGSYKNTGALVIDTKKTITFTNSDNFSAEYLNIFGAGTNDRAENLAFYGLEIKNNGVTVFDAVPAWDDDGNACLYEKIADKFYYARGGVDKFEGGYDA